MNFIKQTRRLVQAILTGLLLMAFTTGAYAQTGGRLGNIAILPFSGGSMDEREGIAEMLSFTQEIMRNFSVIPRTDITNAARQEQAFQNLSGMTDPDNAARLGNQIGANYMLLGSITSLGERNLLIVSIIKIDVIRQVAGDYIVYDSLDAINKDKTLLNTMGANLVKMARGISDRPDKLTLLPVEFSGGANKQEGDTLAQLLAIHLLQNGKYAVHPRTKTLEQVLNEYKTQQTSGFTRPGEAVRVTENPRLALSVISRKIGSSTRFNAGIIALEDEIQIDGYSELYAGLSDGMEAMELLARELSGKVISPEERNRRMNTVITIIRNMEKAKKKAENAIVQAEEAVAWAESMGANAIAQAKEAVVQAKKSIARAKESIARADEAIMWADKAAVLADEARSQAEKAIALVKDKKRDEEWDKFLRNSIIVFGVWGGISFGEADSHEEYTNKDTGVEKTSPAVPTSSSAKELHVGFSGGGSIELRMYPRFGIQTGINVITDYVSYTSPDQKKQYETLTTVQVPVLARLNYHFIEPGYGGGNAGANLGLFTGLGLNAATKASVDPAIISFIIGGEVGLFGGYLDGFFVGYQFNGDIGGSSITVDGASYNYTRGSHVIYAALRFYVPLRQ
ncbi:hypothetical protein FACS1894200_03840 [Spirochaetia bacterium]|nr:hypothetical protein FACS1894200_03840 [Spirochaetia bacterium]